MPVPGSLQHPSLQLPSLQHCSQRGAHSSAVQLVRKRRILGSCPDLLNPLTLPGNVPVWELRSGETEDMGKLCPVGHAMHLACPPCVRGPAPRPREGCCHVPNGPCAWRSTDPFPSAGAVCSWSLGPLCMCVALLDTLSTDLVKNYVPCFPENKT